MEEKKNVTNVKSIGDAWAIMRSRTHQGRIYYFNTLTGEAVWNLSESKVQKASALGSHAFNFPEPKEPPKDLPIPSTSKTDFLCRPANASFQQTGLLQFLSHTPPISYTSSTTDVSLQFPPNVWQIPPKINMPTLALPSTPFPIFDNLHSHPGTAVGTTTLMAPITSLMNRNSHVDSVVFAREMQKKREIEANRHNQAVAETSQDSNKDVMNFLKMDNQMEVGDVASATTSSVDTSEEFDDSSDDVDDKWLSENMQLRGTKAVIDVTPLKVHLGCQSDKIWFLIPDMAVLLNNMNFINILVNADDECNVIVTRLVFAAFERAAARRGRAAARLLQALLNNDRAFVDFEEEPCANCSDSIVGCCQRLVKQDYKIMVLTNDVNILKEINRENEIGFTIDDVKLLLANKKEFMKAESIIDVDEDLNEKFTITIPNNETKKNLVNAEVQTDFDFLSNCPQNPNDSVNLKVPQSVEPSEKSTALDNVVKKRKIILNRNKVSQSGSEIPNNKNEKKVKWWSRKRCSAQTNLVKTTNNLLVHEKTDLKNQNEVSTKTDTELIRNDNLKETSIAQNCEEETFNKTQTKINISKTAQTYFTTNLQGKELVGIKLSENKNSFNKNTTIKTISSPSNGLIKTNINQTVQNNCSDNEKEKELVRIETSTNKKVFNKNTTMDTVRSRSESLIKTNINKTTQNKSSTNEQEKEMIRIETPISNKSFNKNTTTKTVRSPSKSSHKTESTTTIAIPKDAKSEETQKYTEQTRSINKPTLTTLIKSPSKTFQVKTNIIIPPKIKTAPIESIQGKTNPQNTSPTSETKPNETIRTRLRSSTSKSSSEEVPITPKIRKLNLNAKPRTNDGTSSTTSHNSGSEKSLVTTENKRIDTVSEANKMQNHNGTEVTCDQNMEPIPKDQSTVVTPSPIKDRCNKEKENMVLEITDNAMEEKLRSGSDEWVSRFVQILEEVLSQVLQQNPLSSQEMLPPWSITEATECLKTKFASNARVRNAAARLTRALAKVRDPAGNIRRDLAPIKFLELFNFAVNFIFALQGVLRDCEDIQIALDSLNKLLKDIRNCDVDAMDFNDHYENERQASDAVDSKDCDEITPEKPAVQPTVTFVRKICTESFESIMAKRNKPQTKILDKQVTNDASSDEVTECQKGQRDGNNNLNIFMCELKKTYLDINYFCKQTSKDFKTLSPERKFQLLKQAEENKEHLKDLLNILNSIVHRENEQDNQMSFTRCGVNEHLNDRQLLIYKNIIHKCSNEGKFLVDALTVLEELLSTDCQFTC